MKLSVSRLEADVRLLDGLAAERGRSSRSAVVQQALRSLRDATLVDDYAAAIGGWSGSEEAADWDQAAADGVSGSAR